MEDKWGFRESGENVVIYEPVTIIAPEKMVLKNNILISEYAYLAGGLGFYIGNYIHIAAHVSVSGGGYCILEDFTGLSAGVRLITGSDDFTGQAMSNPMVPTEFRKVTRSFVHLEKHALLATGVIVHPGVTIGEGAVASSGSVVTSDLEPWSIYRGIPARKVRERPRDRILSFEKELARRNPDHRCDFSEIADNIKKELKIRGSGE